MEVNRIADYEYEVIIDGQRTIMDLEKLMRLLSSPIKKEPATNPPKVTTSTKFIR